MDEKKNYYQLIPKKELKCVWMTAGMISYKLCKYDLQCDRCPLDWELRNLSDTPSFDPSVFQKMKTLSSAEAGSDAPCQMKEPGEEFSREDLSLFNIKESLFYHPGHTWVKVEKADEVRIGLDYFLGKMIGRVKVVVLPLSGRKFGQGENLCSIIQEEGILHMVFPVSGLILSVNPKLKDQPELIAEDPLGEGFLLTLKPKNLQREQSHLFFGETALSWYQKELERFKTVVISELYGQERVGMTMQDGKTNLREMKHLIDPERYIRLVSTFLRMGEKDFPSSKYKKQFHNALAP